MRTRLLAALLCGLLAPAAGLADAARLAAFQTLLQESGLQLEQPPGYGEAAVRPNPLMAYEHALVHDSGNLEMRFMVRPLNRIEIEYNDPHNASPEPNHLFPLLFESITNRLARDGHAPSNVLSQEEAREAFNAQWAAISVFDVDPEFTPDYRNAVLVAMHRNDQADAYTLLLYNDRELAEPLIRDSISSMSFAVDAP